MDGGTGQQPHSVSMRSLWQYPFAILNKLHLCRSGHTRSCKLTGSATARAIHSVHRQANQCLILKVVRHIIHVGTSDRPLDFVANWRSWACQQGRLLRLALGLFVHCSVPGCRLILPTGSNAVMSMWSSGPDAWIWAGDDDMCNLCVFRRLCS